MTRVSVIIPSVNGLPEIDECLRALERQDTSVEYEVVVADRCRDGTAEHIARRFPRVKLLHFDEPLGIPQLRARAMDVATGGIIAVTEDHCIATDNWISEIVGAMERGYEVVGGAIENGKTDRVLDWSAFLCEYSGATPPIPDGEVHAVAGNNAAYKREVLESVDERIRRNYWEYFLMAELRKNGARFLSVPGMRVIHRKEFGFFYFLSQRFHYSRSFAGMRRGLISPARRSAYILASPALPLVHGARMVRDVVRKKRLYKPLLLSLPSLALFLIAYAAGECVGYLSGPGSSLSRIE
jgi:GT2 family glycosyltransferase